MIRQFRKLCEVLTCPKSSFRERIDQELHPRIWTQCSLEMTHPFSLHEVEPAVETRTGAQTIHQICSSLSRRRIGLFHQFLEQDSTDGATYGFSNAQRVQGGKDNLVIGLREWTAKHHMTKIYPVARVQVYDLLGGELAGKFSALLFQVIVWRKFR